MRPLPHARNCGVIVIRLTGSGVVLRFLVAMFYADYGLDGLALFGCDAVAYGVADNECDYGHPCVLVYGSDCH